MGFRGQDLGHVEEEDGEGADATEGGLVLVRLLSVRAPGVGLKV